MDILVFFPDVLDLRQLVRLVIVGDRLTCHAVGIAPFLQGSIVEFPRTLKRPLQGLRLFLRWIQSEFVGLLRHAFGSLCTAS
jgi:hypothetical protein